MSKIALTPNASGTGIFTVASPNSSTDRTLTLPDETGTVATVENLPAAAFGRVVRTAGSITTTSTSLVDVTGATVTFTTGAYPVAYGVKQVAYSSAILSAYFNIMVDGVLELGTNGLGVTMPTAGYLHNCSLSGQTVPLTAASHTIKEQWRVDSNTGTLQMDGASNHMFYAQEIR